MPQFTSRKVKKNTNFLTHKKKEEEEEEEEEGEADLLLSLICFSSCLICE